MTNFRANEIAFERAARDYYLARTGRADWSEISPPLRAYYRQELARAANELDAEITRLVEEADNEKSPAPI